MLEISHFTKRYGSELAVSDLTITVKPGDVCGFIGHNGAGKTTTLRAVAGILDFDEGDIKIGGRSIRTEPLACKKETAYIPDNPDLYDYLTGAQYVSFVADIYGVSKDRRDKLTKEYAGALEMEKNLGKLIGSMSHGMRQKVAILAALVHEPKLLLLDEPFVGLDPIASHTLKEILSSQCRAGAAVFFSTHVLEVAEKICNSVAIIRQGKLVASGTMDEVRGDQSLESVFLELSEHA